ncbi:MAG: phosphonate transporter [Hyphomicrobiales bacterium]|nr:MAG: phosphonate transporter [Hyphomicrobiales bacterium]
MLLGSTPEDLDQLPFGVIGFDREGIVRQYNAWEAKAAGLTQSRVIGQPLFTSVAPCMNNYLVAQRFEDAAGDKQALDRTLPYVLTLRMRPTKVLLRLLAPAVPDRRFVLVQWTP